MAAEFKVIGAAAPITTPDVIYTVPALTTAIIIGLQAANVDAADHWVTVSWSDGVNTFDLVNEVTVPEDAALGVLAGKLVLQAGYTLSVVADAADEIELSVSVLELS